MISPSTREKLAAQKPLANPNRRIFISWWDNLRNALGLMNSEEYRKKQRRDDRLRIFASRNMQRIVGTTSSLRALWKKFPQLALPKSKKK